MIGKTFVEGYWRKKQPRVKIVEKRIFVPFERRPTMEEKARWLF